MQPSLLASELDLHLSKDPSPATGPPEWRGVARDEVKLLVLDRKTERTAHARFHELASFLDPGDVLIINTSGTVAANVRARSRTNYLRLHIAVRLESGAYIVERRNASDGPDEHPFSQGEQLEVINERDEVIEKVTVREQFHPRSRFWIVDAPSDLFQLAAKVGKPIRYDYVVGDPDIGAFQTIFARDFHSAEMPSAARPFSPRVMRALGRRGVRIGSLTLHTGVSSHEVKEDMANHPVLPEWYRIPPYTASLIRQAQADGRRIIAVGTTVVRAIEGSFRKLGFVQATEGWTDHLVTPDTPPRVVTGLVTGLHERQSSHLALLYAFVQREMLRLAYEEAVSREYLWHEFGDSHLIL